MKVVLIESFRFVVIRFVIGVGKMKRYCRNRRKTGLGNFFSQPKNLFQREFPNPVFGKSIFF